MKERHLGPRHTQQKNTHIRQKHQRIEGLVKDGKETSKDS